MTLLLSRSDLEQLVDMPATLSAIESAFSTLGATPSRAEQPPAFVINEGRRAVSARSELPEDAKFLVLAALSHSLGVAATKTFADVPANLERGLPGQRSLISLFSADEGEPLAILDGRVPTRERTAATTAVATKYLARPDSRVLGLIGAGGLAAPHVRALTSVAAIEEIRVWSRSTERVEQLREQLDDLLGSRIRFVACTDPADAVRGSDIVCTLTPASSPVVEREWFSPGTHLNAVGARPRPNHREIDSATVADARIVVDDLSAALTKSGDLVIPMTEGLITASDIGPSLAEVVAGTAVGRRDAKELTLFNSVGTGLQDLAIGTLYYERALARSLGTQINFSA